MARTIDYLTLMVSVTPYEHEGHNYDALSIIVAFRRGRGFCITWQPVKIEPNGYMTGPMPSSDPLVGGGGFVAKAASRNNVKALETMRAGLLLGKDGIKFYFDQRDYDRLKEFMGDVCNYGYTAQAEKQLKDAMAMKAAEETPIMKQYHQIKSKHPDAVLLFRCGDFYETYEDDAKVCAEILGIALTKRTSDGTTMAGFPYHALDTYLPRLVRAGQRVAICDQLDPPKPTKKSAVSELINNLTTNNRNNNPQTTNTTMKLSINNTNNESANVQNVQVNDNAAGAIVPATSIEDADFEEVKDDPQPSSINHQLPKVSFSTYTTKRGETAPQIIGFGGEDDPRWKKHLLTAEEKKAGKKSPFGASFRRDIQGNILIFGVRYMEAAKALAGAYNTDDVNAWQRAEDAVKAIYEQAQREGKARWEAKKAHWAEAAAMRAAEKKREKVYTASDVAALLKAIAEGGDIPEDVKKLMAAA